MKLCDAKLNKSYEIVNIGKCALYERLLEVGFTLGERVLVLKKSPLKKSFLLTLRNSTIAIDYDTMSCIEVK